MILLTKVYWVLIRIFANFKIDPDVEKCKKPKTGDTIGFNFLPKLGTIVIKWFEKLQTFVFDIYIYFDIPYLSRQNDRATLGHGLFCT